MGEVHELMLNMGDNRLCILINYMSVFSCNTVCFHFTVIPIVPDYVYNKLCLFLFVYENLSVIGLIIITVIHHAEFVNLNYTYL